MEVCENKMKAEGWYRKYFENEGGGDGDGE